MLHFDPVARVWVLSYRVEDAILQQLFLISLCLFDSIFSELVWIDKLQKCVEGIALFKNSWHGNRKWHYFSYHSKSSKGEKILNQRHESYTFERPQIKLVRVDWISTRQEKMLQPQKGTFWKKKAKKLTHFYISWLQCTILLLE